jgi:putative phosphoesterase
MPSRSTRAEALRVGLVSDTHDLLRPELLAYLRDSDHIIHAGDLCSAAVLEALAQLAPLTAVRGNNDRGDWAQSLAEAVTVEIGGIAIHVVHDRKELRLPGGVRVVVSGHSHRPGIEEREGVLHVNPGSAGPRRFRLPISAAELRIAGGQVHAQLQTF